MIKYNKHILELITYIKEETELYNKNISSLSKLDYVILKKILDIVVESKKYIFNYPNEDYIDPEMVKNFKAIDYKESFVFETQITHHEIFSGYIEYSLDIPTVFLIVKKENPLLRDLIKITGSSFFGDFIFYFRKIEDKWMIPSKGAFYNKELKLLDIVEVFKKQSLNYDIKYDGKEYKDNIQTFKRFLFKMYIESTNIIENENFEEFLIDSNEKYYTSSAFLKSETKLNYDQKMNRHRTELINKGILDDIAKTGIVISQ